MARKPKANEPPADRNEALRRNAQSMIDHAAAKRAKAPSRPPKEPRKDKAAPPAVASLVTPEARQHGHYAEVDFKLQEVVEGGKTKAKTIQVVRNLGGTPVERWHSRGALDERQMAAIGLYQQIWARHIGEPRVVANWSAVIVRSISSGSELYANSGNAAKETLRLLDQEVFFRLPVEHFHVFQNVVIWDEAAGVAGSRVGFQVKKSAETAARLIVATIASMIADLVIDGARKDFEAELLDLDRARAPGRRPNP